MPDSCDYPGVATAVLLVDDDASFRELAGRLLVSMGFTVVGESATVAEAVAAAIALRPDAALVDIGLPDGDGFALASALAALPYPPRVVLTSSDPDVATPSRVREVGAAGFVDKQDLPHPSLKDLLVGE
jgi:DNA-binding NarL/FixJ family response regulator